MMQDQLRFYAKRIELRKTRRIRLTFTDHITIPQQLEEKDHTSQETDGGGASFGGRERGIK